MEATDDWRQRLKTSESKSMGIDTGNSVMMSSIDGWKGHSLPKLLIIWKQTVCVCVRVRVCVRAVVFVALCVADGGN